MTESFEQQMGDYKTKDYFVCIKTLLPRFITILETDSLDVLEIGTDIGISTKAFLENAFVKSLVSIDIKECPLAEDEVKELGRMDDWTFIRGDSREIMPKQKQKYDIVYVDGDHSGKAASKDINMAWGLVKTPGILMIHDVLHQKNFTGNTEYMGVTRAMWGFMWEKKIEAVIYPTYLGMAYLIKN